MLKLSLFTNQVRTLKINKICSNTKYQLTKLFSIQQFSQRTWASSHFVPRGKKIMKRQQQQPLHESHSALGKVNCQKINKYRECDQADQARAAHKWPARPEAQPAPTQPVLESPGQRENFIFFVFSKTRTVGTGPWGRAGGG